MLMARAKEIELATGLQQVANEWSKTNSLIGAALKLLTDNAENQATLKTSLGTLTRVLDAVNWSKISKGNPEAWLYFYEHFLEIYDNRLRKLTGSRDSRRQQNPSLMRSMRTCRPPVTDFVHLIVSGSFRTIDSLQAQSGVVGCLLRSAGLYDGLYRGISDQWTCSHLYWAHP